MNEYKKSIDVEIKFNKKSIEKAEKDLDGIKNIKINTDDIDELAKCVKDAINSYASKKDCQLNGTRVEEVLVNELHKSTFEKDVYHHDALDSELLPDVEDKFDAEDEPEVLVERPKVKVEKRSKFIRK